MNMDSCYTELYCIEQEGYLPPKILLLVHLQHFSGDVGAALSSTTQTMCESHLRCGYRCHFCSFLDTVDLASFLPSMSVVLLIGL